MVSAKRLGAKLRTAEIEGGLELASPLRMIGADGGTGGSGTAKGVPVSQSHNERLSGRRARPSHEGGALDQIAQPPSCIPITHMIESRYHILLMPLISSGLMPVMSFSRLGGRCPLRSGAPHAAALAAGAHCREATAGRPARAGIAAAGGSRGIGDQRARHQPARE
jgi:hypothetical protein